jgi:hypothetical protein
VEAVSDRDWTGTFEFDPRPERTLQEGSRIHIPAMGDDVVLVVDHVAEPDDEGVVQLTVHSEPRET